MKVEYLLWLNFFHCDFFDPAFSHVVSKHCIKVRNCSCQHNSVGGEGMIINLLELILTLNVLLNFFLTRHKFILLFKF